MGQIVNLAPPTATMNPIPIAFVGAGYNSIKYISSMI